MIIIKIVALKFAVAVSCLHNLSMGFYQLPRSERSELVSRIQSDIRSGLEKSDNSFILEYAADADTYIRKSAYLAVGRLYLAQPALQQPIRETLGKLMYAGDFRLRQTAINAAGEIGKSNFEVVRHFFDLGLSDAHHSPRNAVIGSIKKMGEVNPGPVLEWASSYLQHPDKEIRREICHGIELRGRKHPGDILPLLRILEFDPTARVRNTLVHVLGQIAYKKGCLEIVVADLRHWQNKKLVQDAFEEIIDVHHRYRDFAAMTQDQAREYIQMHRI